MNNLFLTLSALIVDAFAGISNDVLVVLIALITIELIYVGMKFLLPLFFNRFENKLEQNYEQEKVEDEKEGG